MSIIKIYRDEASLQVVIEDNLAGSRALNTLQAVVVDNDLISIVSIYKFNNGAPFYEYINKSPLDFVDENDQVYGSDALTVSNQLNSIFASTGTDSVNPPIITSPTQINAVSGENINYTLTADFGVGYEWSNLPSGLVTAEGNTRRLIGSLDAGVYTPTMIAVNYNGSDSEVLTINVSNPPFANTKSINFVNNDYLRATAFLFQSVLGRVGNGSGSNDAWTLSLRFKAGTSLNQDQTLMYFGDSNYFSNGTVKLYYNAQRGTINLLFGNFFNALTISTVNNAINAGEWTHILISYDGGTTGPNSNQLDDYYSRFKIILNGVDSAYNNSHQNYGYAGSIQLVNFFVGRYANGSYMRNNCRVDELAVFDSDQSDNAPLIYNNGTPFDLSTLLSPPSHWWRMGDGDTYPILADSISNADLTMLNMTAADIVNDTP